MSPKPIPSTSEDHGVAALRDTDLTVYSVGISTAGFAEIRMAKAVPQRKIVATTISQKGAEYTRRLCAQEDVSDQISVHLEDVRKPLPHKSDSFDFIYARLVLHYLPKADLDNALKELYRVLKPQGRIFVVVLSTDCKIIQAPGASHNPSTGMTTILLNQGPYSRYFHTESSICAHLASVGFSIQSTQSYQEVLCSDYDRQHLSDTSCNLIESIGVKE